MCKLKKWLMRNNESIFLWPYWNWYKITENLFESWASGTLRTGTSSCARAARYHTNAIAVSDFTIATRKWANLYKHRIRRSVTRSEKCFIFTLQKGSLLRPVRALPLEVSQRECPANRFKLLPISRGCTDNFHVHDNHMHVVWSHVLAT